LDVQTRRLLWDYAKKLNREFGTSILLNTHYVEEADCLCDKIAIMNQGKIVVIDTPQRLKDSVSDSLLSVKLSQGSDDDLVELLKGMTWVNRISRHDGRLELSIGSGGTKMPEVVRLARNHGFAISSISEHKPSLEDVFLHYVGKKLKCQEHE
jgi:ABC-2 type transport system ATP-binding protein